jgi:hypothetical protein
MGALHWFSMLIALVNLEVSMTRLPYYLSHQGIVHDLCEAGV